MGDRMRTRLRRRVFSYVCGLSLLAFAVTLVLWVRSYSDTDCIQHATDTSYAAVLTSRGRLLLRFDAIPQSAPTRFPPQAVGTLYWRREREAEGKACRCGYSLTGNTSGTCPECGSRIPQQSVRGV